MTFGVGNGAAGTVTLGSNINVSNLIFAAADSGNYTIAGGGYSLALQSVGSTITTNVAATISAPMWTRPAALPRSSRSGQPR